MDNSLAEQLAAAIEKPLSTIQLAGGLISEDDANQRAAVITEQCHRINELLRATRRYSRCTPDPEPADINAAVFHAAHYSRVEHMHLADNLPNLPHDYALIRDAMIELIKNAEESLAESIAVTTSYKAGRVMVSVVDDGAGISTANMSRVFQPYWSTKGLPGMGLPYVLRVVEMHRGEIEIQSEHGAGTRFTLNLPVK